MLNYHEFNRYEEQRPLFTITVLVSGVVGGLAVVIAVVYLYRFCLKKRPPVTTTGVPEAKREQIRSNATCQSRPLPLPLATADSAQFVMNSPSKEYSKETVMKRDSTFASPTRIAEVFPLLPKERAFPYVQRSVQDVSQNKSLLSVTEGSLRAHSVELLQDGVDEQMRRASFDVPRGTGRQLPSTEGLEKQYAERTRRLSTLSRSDAVQQSGYHPIKQFSNPLPEQRCIYERNHTHSRSWNVETDRRGSPPSNQLDDYHYYRTTKSFEDRSGGREVQRMSMDRRALSDMRHQTTELLQPETSVAAACQSLWAAKGHLEELHALGITDPSSASTSFESNTDNSPANGSGETKAREEPAQKKRLQYKSMFLRRKFLSTGAVSSRDSTNSTESSAPEAIFGSSVDSAGDDLEHRRRSLMSRLAAGSVPQIISVPSIANINPLRNSQRLRQMPDRDFSVDAQSDTLFREWSRVDPAYERRDGRNRREERRRLDRGASEDQSTFRRGGVRLNSRQLTTKSGSSVILPYIRYPDEAICGR
uniref:Uncharacterized protein n=1 Tax=Haemonchus contortus TaxID=6289 RepID=A0A7I4Y1R2_HAECO